MNWWSLDNGLLQLGIDNASYRNAIVLFLIMLLTAAASFVSAKLFKSLEKRVTATENLWDDNVLHAARAPVSLAIWLLGISVAAIVAQTYSGAEVFGAMGHIQKAGVIICLTWFLVRFVSGAELILISPERMKQPMDETTVQAIGKLVRASIVITAILVILQTLGFSISGVLAFGGIGGIAVGFAAKDLLANFFGGLMVYLDRPFKVGDWIRSPEKDIEGIVEKIGWRLTTIRTFDKRPLYVPNAAFTSISVQNPSRMLNRRIYETIGIRYDDISLMADVVGQVKSMLQNHPDIDHTQTLMVNFNSFAPSSCDFFIYTFTKTTDWAAYHAVKQDVLLQIIHIITELGAEIAFPTSTLHLRTDAQPEIKIGASS